jgi:hypothetical protein
MTKGMAARNRKWIKVGARMFVATASSSRALRRSGRHSSAAGHCCPPLWSWIMAFAVLTMAGATNVGQAQSRLPEPGIAFVNSGAAAAQPAFRRSMAALHNFAYRTAADTFRQAEAIDPDFALAYWGEAMAHAHLVWGTENLEGGRRALQKFERRPSTAMTTRERAYLAAAQALFASGDREARTASFEARMRGARLHQRSFGLDAPARVAAEELSAGQVAAGPDALMAG